MQKLVIMLGLMAALAMPVMGDTITYPFHMGNTTGQPANIPAETARLQGLIDGWNLGGSIPTLPALSGVDWNWVGEKTEVTGGGPEVTIPLAGFNGYVMLKWGNQDCFYRLSDTGLTDVYGFSQGSYDGAGNYTFYSDVFGGGGGHNGTRECPRLGLSHWTVWGDYNGGGSGDPDPSVPEGGMTMALMAFGLVSLAGVKKYAFA